MPHILISAAHKSSGKTTVCIGICAELHRRNIKVQPFKKGPDYIDPMWLTQASGRACYNLDFYTQPPNEILDNFSKRMYQADLGIIEGNKGLYDGLALDGSNSNAALAILLGSPVVLVIDVSGMNRGVAPLLLGFQAFDTKVRIAGVILNKVGGARHESKLRQVIKHYTNLPVLGVIQRSRELELVERHLGLIPSNEAVESSRQIEAIRAVVAAQVDMDELQQIAATAAPTTIAALSTESVPLKHLQPLRIGIAQGAAFGFYYPGDLETMEQYGAKLVPFDPVHDASLPNVDGIFIGGGFPEARMHELEQNQSLRQALAEYVETGRPVYAECGGLMYLCRSISWNGQTCAMVDVIPADAVMYERPQGRGYVRLRATALCPWPGKVGEEIFAHEFHYSRLENLAPNQKFAFEILRGDGIDGVHDGIVYKNLLAGYAHLRNVQAHIWTKLFLDFVRNC